MDDRIDDFDEDASYFLKYGGVKPCIDEKTHLSITDAAKAIRAEAIRKEFAERRKVRYPGFYYSIMSNKRIDPASKRIAMRYIRYYIKEYTWMTDPNDWWKSPTGEQLNCAFLWEKSPQGWEFWRNIQDKIS